jgi:hypothetical protein
MTIELEDFVTENELAEFLGVSVEKLKQYKVPCVRLSRGSVRLYHKQSVAAWLFNRQRPEPPNISKS